MAITHAELVNDVEVILQDGSNAVYTALELQDALDQAVKLYSRKRPNEVMVTMELESRTGTCTTTFAGPPGKLTDATESQFVAGDVGKVIHNTTDNTYAIVLVQDSTSVLTISADIMIKDEGYEIFNQGCITNRQLYLGNIPDWIGNRDNRGVVRVEYRIGQTPPEWRRFDVKGKVLTIETLFAPEDTATGSAKVEVNVTVQRPHLVSRLTDLESPAAGAELVGAISMDVDGLSGSEVVPVGQEFVIYNTSNAYQAIRGTYYVTKEVTLSSGATSSNGLEFWPPLESPLADDEIVRFTGSTLDPDAERIVTEIAAGRAAISKAQTYQQQITKAVAATLDAHSALDKQNAELVLGIADLASGRTQTGLMAAVILEANVEVDRMLPLIQQGSGSLDSGAGTANAITLGGPSATGQFGQLAQGRYNAAASHLEAGRGYLNQVEGQDQNSRSFAQLALAEFQAAAGETQAAGGYLNEVSGEVSIVDRGREFAEWGRQMIADAMEDLELGRHPNQKFRHSRGASVVSSSVKSGG